MTEAIETILEMDHRRNVAPASVPHTSNPIRGIVQVTGEPDTGKTTFALTSGAHPSRTLFVDDDVKGKETVEQYKRLGMPFGKSVPMVEDTRGMKELDLHRYGLDLMRSIQPGEFDVIVWDTFARFENTFFPYVHAHPGEFKAEYSPMGAIKGAEMWIESFRYEAQFLAELAERVPLVILVSHLHDQNNKGIKTGKQVPEMKRSLGRNVGLRLWLRHNPDSPAPIGLVLKRITKWAIGASGLPEPVAVLPRKINPCTWAHILEYWENPIGNRPATPEETPDAFELSLLEGTLTPDQKEIFLTAMRAGLGEKESFDAIAEASQPAALSFDPIEAKARLAITEPPEAKITPVALAKELGVSLPELMKAVNAVK